jgi:hypothetical protein
MPALENRQFSSNQPGLKNFTAFLLLALFFAILNSHPAHSQGTRFQTWHSEEIHVPLSTRLKAILSSESRYENGMLDYQAEDVSLLLSVSRKADLEAGWDSNVSNNGSGWLTENDFYGSYIVKGRFWFFDLSDRNRMELLTFTYDKPSYVRYRNKLTLTVPGRIRPYVADEVFYGLGGGHDGVDRNRLWLGVKGDIGRDGQLDCYIMRQTDATFLEQGETRKRFYAVGGNLTIRF